MAPTTNLLDGLRRMGAPGELFPWDDYYARMAQTDFLAGHADQPAVKTFFVRYAPFGGSYFLLGGVADFLGRLDDYRFEPEVLDGLGAMGYRPEWRAFLRERGRLRVRVVAGLEGSVALPNEPVISLLGPLHDLRLAEGILLPAINPASLWLTKWQRLVEAASPATAVDFGRRRAQDTDRSSLYAYLAGCAATSNAQIRAWFDIPITGTSGHEAIQSVGDEFAAFDVWLAYNPDRPTLLVDTINTLDSGIPNAIAAFQKHRAAIRAAGGKPTVRIDSGDLAYLALAAIRKLDDAGLADVGIMLTNDLDEYLVEAIKGQILQHAPEFRLEPAAAVARVVAFPAGTRPSTCYDQPALGGVAKLVQVGNSPRIKISDNPTKTSLPGYNRSAFIWKGDELVDCLVFPDRDDPFADAGHPAELLACHPDDPAKRMVIRDYRAEPRQRALYDGIAGPGFTSAWDNPSLEDVRERVRSEVSRLHWTSRRLENPHQIKLSVTPELFALRRRMIEGQMLRADAQVGIA